MATSAYSQFSIFTECGHHYLGPEVPEGDEDNWIQSNEGELFFMYLGLYGSE